MKRKRSIWVIGKLLYLFYDKPAGRWDLFRMTLLHTFNRYDTRRLYFNNIFKYYI
jgi:hypothetical protein